MNRPEPKLIIFSAILSLLAAFMPVAHSGEITSPISPIIYGDGKGGFELYWFRPGKFVQNIGNNNIIPDRGMVLSLSDRQHCILTTINLTPPYYIKNANTYIFNSDPFPELPGDQLTPIRMAIKTKVSDNYYDDIWYENSSIVKDAWAEIKEYENSIHERDLKFHEFESWD